MLLLAWVSVAGAETVEWQFNGWPGAPIPVQMYVPDDDAASARVVIVMHGASRDAPRYFNDWQTLGEQHNLIVVVPYFSKDDFAGSAKYNLGHVFEKETGKLRAEELWTFSAIEPLFDEVVKRVGSMQKDYALYGHSAGSQFVHRFMYYVPETSARLFVAANAGWYTMPTDDFEYPYGLINSGVGAEQQIELLSKPLVLLLGAEDKDSNASKLRKTPEALQQGPNRLARGLAMHRVAKARAEELGVEFGWKLYVVKGADHDNGKMAPTAAALIRQ